MWFQFSKACNWYFHLSLLNTKGLHNELAGKVQSQTSCQLETEELGGSKGPGMPKGHGHHSLASVGTKQLCLTCQLQHLLGFAPGWALSDSPREIRASNVIVYRLKYWKYTWICYQIRTSKAFKNVFLILVFDSNESSRIWEINESHLKWDIVSNLCFYFFFFFGQDLCTVGKNQKREYNKPNELSDLKSVVIVEADEKSQ